MSVSAPMSQSKVGLHGLSGVVGNWSLSRRITHADGREDRFDGTCVFKRSGPRVIQDEVGVLETAEGRFEGTRRYVWAEAKGRLDVHFDDMRPFHSVPLGVARPEATHLCPPDRYEVRYDFTAWPDWTSIWHVEGPRKDYVMTNWFSPAGTK